MSIIPHTRFKNGVQPCFICGETSLVIVYDEDLGKPGCGVFCPTCYTKITDGWAWGYDTVEQAVEVWNDIIRPKWFIYNGEKETKPINNSIIFIGSYDPEYLDNPDPVCIGRVTFLNDEYLEYKKYKYPFVKGLRWRYINHI